MLERLVSFSVGQRVFVLVIVLALAVFGTRSALNVPIEAFPDVQDVQVQVVTQYLDQAPEEVERAITLPIEREMAGVPRMTQLRSVSITGLSVVTLTFSDGTDDYFVRQQVLEKLQNVVLPAGSQPSLAPLTTAVGEVYRYMIEAPADMPDFEVRTIQDWLIRPALRMVPGIADVVSFGGAIKEYQVRLNPYLLRKHSITIDQVTAAVGSNSANAGGGLMARGEQALVVRGLGIVRTLDDIGRIAITTHPGGRPVLVSDVAEEIVIGPRQRSGIVGYNERDTIVEGIVVMIKGQNAAKVVEALREKVLEVQAKLPEGMRIVPFYQRTDLIAHTVETVGENLAMGALLVISILMVFLRNWKAALIVAAVIPLSMLAAFTVIDMRGISANLISLGAVDFGIIVDSSVVLVEALMVRFAIGLADQSGAPRDYNWRLATIRSTVVDLGKPILFAKAIIILAFLPIFTFQRVEGKIFSPVAFTLSFALVGAIALTLTLVPALLSYAVRGDFAEKESRWMHTLQERYRRLLLAANPRRRLIVLASYGIFGVAAVGAPLLGSEFLPKLDEGNIWLTIALAPSSALGETKSVEREVRRILRSYPEVGNIVTQVGRPDDGTDPKGSNNLEVLADLKPRETWNFASKEALIADMSAKIRKLPGVPTNFSQVIQDNVEEAMSGVKGEIAVKVFGPDLEILEDKAEQIATILAKIRGAADVAAIKVGGQTELNIQFDRLRLARFGISMTDANLVVQAALAGMPVNVFYDGDRRFDIVVRMAQRYRDSVDDIGSIQIALPNGAGSVSIGDVATIEVRQGAARISREGGGRNVAVKTNLLGRDQGSFVAEAQKKVAAQVQVPPGYRITWGGQFENQQRAAKRLQIIVPISGLLIFCLLFWAFKSIRKALLVLAMVPFTLIGGIAALGLAGFHLSISAAVGFIAIAGISVQNGVIMVDHITDLVRGGSTVAEAVIGGAVDRLRPILMTALMAGLGLLPAALSHGIGSETQRPFALVIVGGIVTDTIFTLLLLPLLYVLVVGRSDERVDQAPS